MTASGVVPPLAEDDRAGIEVTLSPAVATALEASGLVHVLPVGPAVWRLVPRGRVGAVHIDGVDVVVTPKVGITRLLFLLGYAADPGFRPEDVAGIHDDDLWPAIAETVCRHAERALGFGVLQGYVTVEAALPLVRGRIRVADQIARRPGMLVPIEVRYDEYSIDIVENRILRSAVRRMLAVPRVSAAVRSRLAHLDARLDGVTVLVSGAPRPTWRPHRLNARYHAALRLAELVLRHQSFEVGPGGLRVAAFVVDMAKVFEDFVATALTEAWAPLPGHTRTQYPARLDETGGVLMRVDVVHLVDGVARIIADAKYKIESGSGRYPNADHYQMLAYCTALQVPFAWLVYASGSPGPVTRRVVHTAISIVECPLDLAASPTALLAQIKMLGHEAWAARSPDPRRHAEA
ncbi:MAG: McrC family protein [Actinomycetota bacterium]|nr:McrC family protein [Actinomycetota bacterium]